MPRGNHHILLTLRRMSMISWKKDPAVQAVAIPAEFMECKVGDILVEAEKPSGETEGRSGGNEPQAEATGGTD